MTITVAMIKELRDSTGAGMMDAKAALTETGGDMKAATDWLRLKGKAKAASKSGRTAAEGLIGMHIGDETGVIVEVNSETDFAARNPEFAQFVVAVARAALTTDDVQSLMAANLGGSTVEEQLTGMVAKLRENLVIRSMQRVSGSSVYGYVHNQVIDGAGKIGTLIVAEGIDSEAGRKIAMHVAAARPISLSEKDAPEERVERERGVLTQMALDSGKPEHIVQKIVDGGLRKFFQAETLLNQKYVVNPDITVEQAAKEAGGSIVGFAYLKVGETSDS